MARRVFLVWLAGAVVRLALLKEPHLWFDEATTGLLGLAVLRGDFPVYFFGQPFMGALDGYLGLRSTRASGCRRGRSSCCRSCWRWRGSASS